MASTLTTQSVRDMLEALIAGERDPRVLAGLARGRMRTKNTELVTALNGRFDNHHGELARMLLDQIDALTGQIDKLTPRIDESIAALQPPPAVSEPGDNADGHHRPTVCDDLPVLQRLAEIPGLSERSAQVVVAEPGLDMTRFPTADHLASWAKLTPRTIQFGAQLRNGKTGRGNPYLKGVLGEAAAAAAKTDTFLGEKYRRIVKRRGKLKALVAVARSVLVIVWHLLAAPAARFQDLGADYHTTRTDQNKKIRNHVRQRQALGFTVTLEHTAA